MENDNQELIEDLPLPVELLYFNGIPKETTIELRWATASEFGNDHFILEKIVFIAFSVMFSCKSPDRVFINNCLDFFLLNKLKMSSCFEAFCILCKLL